MFVKDKIKTLRNELGITRYEVAKRAGCSVNLVDNIELGYRKDPQLSTLIKIAKGLGISVSELLKDILEEENV